MDRRDGPGRVLPFEASREILRIVYGWTSFVGITPEDGHPRILSSVARKRSRPALCAFDPHFLKNSTTSRATQLIRSIAPCVRAARCGAKIRFGHPHNG